MKFFDEFFDFSLTEYAMANCANDKGHLAQTRVVARTMQMRKDDSADLC